MNNDIQHTEKTHSPRYEQPKTIEEAMKLIADRIVRQDFADPIRRAVAVGRTCEFVIKIKPDRDQGEFAITLDLERSLPPINFKAYRGVR